MPKLTALARLRSAGVTSSTGTPKTRAAVAAWKSAPELNAATRCSNGLIECGVDALIATNKRRKRIEIS